MDRKLSVMDVTAFAFAMEKKIRIKISGLDSTLLVPDCIEKSQGTLVM